MEVFEYCAREGAQIFGGLGYTRGGQGEKVERLAREVLRSSASRCCKLEKARSRFYIEADFGPTICLAAMRR